MNEPSAYIVDYTDAVRESLAVLLESCGYRVATYESARAFLDIWPRDLTACLCAYKRGTGRSCRGRVAAILPGLAVIIMTGHGAAPVAVRAMKAGAECPRRATFSQREFEPIRPGGLRTMSYTTQLIPHTSLMMYVAMSGRSASYPTISSLLSGKLYLRGGRRVTAGTWPVHRVLGALCHSLYLVSRTSDRRVPAESRRLDLGAPQLTTEHCFCGQFAAGPRQKAFSAASPLPGHPPLLRCTAGLHSGARAAHCNKSDLK